MSASPNIEIEESIRRMNPIAAPEDQLESLTALVHVLKQMAPEQMQSAAFKLVIPTGEILELPESVFLLLERIIEVLERGDAISLVPVGRELTTQQAADILNVSRQYLVRLLDDGRVPHKKVGTHRRLQMEDVVAYKFLRDRERMSALDELSQQSQDLGGYAEIFEED